METLKLHKLSNFLIASTETHNESLGAILSFTTGTLIVLAVVQTFFRAFSTSVKCMDNELPETEVQNALCLYRNLISILWTSSIPLDLIAELLTGCVPVIRQV